MPVFDYLREALGVAALEKKLEETERRLGRVERLLDNPQLLEFIDALASSSK